MKKFKSFKSWCQETGNNHLLDEWDYNKNQEITPENISYGSNKKIWWICSKGHSWERCPHDIKNETNLCPVCKKENQEKRTDTKTKKNCKNNKQITKHKKKQTKTTLKQPITKTNRKKYQFEDDILDESKFLVIDVETNGLNSKNCDLLEVAIYRPDTNTMYHKLLPLEKNNNVYTAEFNGLTKSKLKKAKALTDEDVKGLIKDFEIDRRILLHYGDLDSAFIREYFSRHKLPLRTSLRFFNFKKNIMSSRFSEGTVTKDNLCKMLGIHGVTDVHDCQNDCLLEWNLFKAMNHSKWLIINDNVYEYSEEYSTPVSLIATHSKLKKLLSDKNELPLITAEYKKTNKRFYMNIKSDLFANCSAQNCGVIIEYLINRKINAKSLSAENHEYYTKNKSKLKFIGKIPGVEDERKISFNKNGNIETVKIIDAQKSNKINDKIYNLSEKGYVVENDKGGLFYRKNNRKIYIFKNTNREKITSQNNKYIITTTPNEDDKLFDTVINYKMQELDKSLETIIEYIKEEIFENKEIYTQELVVNEDESIISICDLSSQDTVLEIKAGCAYPEKYKYQLYFESHLPISKNINKNLYREVYLMSFKKYNTNTICVSIKPVTFNFFNTKTEMNKASHWTEIEQKEQATCELIDNSQKKPYQTPDFIIINDVL